MTRLTHSAPPLPYNHLSRPEARAPLPFRQAEPEEPRAQVSSGWSRAIANVRTASGRTLRIGLDTDSAHIAAFFRLNWPLDDRVGEPLDGHITVRGVGGACGGATPSEASAILVSPDARRARITGCDYYTKVKTTLRAMCSVLAPPDEIFLHGCSLEVDGVGLLICGESGAGKTTLAGAILDRAGSAAAVVNDDWGSLSLVGFAAVYTGETRLHMKYRSVSAMRPDLPIGPGRYASEDFGGDPKDADARLMIPRADVFGVHRIIDVTLVRKVLFISREDADAPFARRLSSREAALIAGRVPVSSTVASRYLDAGLLLDDPQSAARQALRLRRLLASGRCVAVNSFGDPAEVAARVFRDVLGVGHGHRRTAALAEEARA